MLTNISIILLNKKPYYVDMMMLQMFIVYTQRLENH